MTPLQQAALWVSSGRAQRALDLLETERPSLQAAEKRATALMVLDRLEDAAAVLDAAERDYPDNAHRLASARLKLSRIKVKPALDRARLAGALATVADMAGEPHPNIFTSTDEMIVCPREGARTVIVSIGLWLPMAAEDLLFASMGWSAVHVPGLQRKFREDPLWMFENRERLVADMTAACASTGARRMVFTGCSGQGMGAIGFGSRCLADAIIAFSPISSLDPNVLAAMSDPRREGSILTPVIAATPRIIEADCLVDLRNNPTETTVVYDPVHPFDCMHAERLAQADHVHMEIMPGEGHLTSQASIADGLFEGFANAALDRALERGETGRHGLQFHGGRKRR